MEELLLNGCLPITFEMAVQCDGYSEKMERGKPCGPSVKMLQISHMALLSISALSNR